MATGIKGPKIFVAVKCHGCMYDELIDHEEGGESACSSPAVVQANGGSPRTKYHDTPDWCPHAKHADKARKAANEPRV